MKIIKRLTTRTVIALAVLLVVVLELGRFFYHMIHATIGLMVIVTVIGLLVLLFEKD